MSVSQVVIGLLMAFLLNVVVALIYRATNQSLSYSQAFTHTLIIMGTVVAAIMIVIGSNIARAFSLVGALSIIRFRTAIKDSRDVAFIFFAMAVGMACGTRFYFVAAFTTAFVGLIVLILFYLRFGSKVVDEYILRVTTEAGAELESTLNAIFQRYLRSFNLVSVEALEEGNLHENVWFVRLGRRADTEQLIEDIKQINKGHRVTLIKGDQKYDI